MYYKDRYLLIEIWQPNSDKPITFNEEWKIVFNVDKNASSDFMSFNTATVSIYNMNSSTRGKISMQGLNIRIYAGYQDLHGKIFNGVINNITVSKDNTDIVTTLYCASDLNGLENDVSDTINSMNLTDYLINLCNKNGIPLKINRINKSIVEYSIDGSVSDTIVRLCSMFGLSYSIDDGVIRIVDKNIKSDDVNDNEIILLTPSTGLLGNPEITEEGCNVRSLLDYRHHVNGYYKLEAPFASYNLNSLNVRPNAVLGGELNALAFIDKKTYNGVYMILSMNIQGDTRGNAWYTNLRGSRLWPKA